MTSARAVRRATVVGGLALVVGALWGASGASVTAQSPAASSSAPSAAVTTPAASPSPPRDLQADCSRVAGLLVPEVDGRRLEWEARAGEDAADPARIRPLLDRLDRTLEDFCLVSFRYGDDQLSQGLAWRFKGADPAILVGAVLDFVAAADTSVTWQRADATIAGRPVTRAEGTDGAEARVVLVYGLGDILVLGQDGPPFEAVLTGLPEPGEPLPDVTAPPSADPTPAP